MSAAGARRVERRVINVGAAPDLDGYRPPVVYRETRRLADRMAYVGVALPELCADRDECGYAARLLVDGSRIVSGLIGVGPGRSPAAGRELGAWAEAHPLETVIGERPWKVVDLAGFNEDFYKQVYDAHRLCIGADLLRTFGLLAERWARLRRGEFIAGFEFGLVGCGVVRERVNGSARWVADYNRPPLRAVARGERSTACAFGFPRPYGNKRTGNVQRRGQWERTKDGKWRSYRGRFWELLGLAHTFTGVSSSELGEYLTLFDLPPVTPHAVSFDDDGLGHLVAVVHAQHQLAVAIDQEAAAW